MLDLTHKLTRRTTLLSNPARNAAKKSTKTETVVMTGARDCTTLDPSQSTHLCYCEGLHSEHKALLHAVA